MSFTKISNHCNENEDDRCTGSVRENGKGYRLIFQNFFLIYFILSRENVPFAKIKTFGRPQCKIEVVFKCQKILNYKPKAIVKKS